MATVTESSYKGTPVLELKAKAEDRFGIAFGPRKARLILDNLDAIRAFVAKHPITDKAAVD